MLGAVASVSSASAITVDGNMVDWNITLKDGVGTPATQTNFGTYAPGGATNLGVFVDDHCADNSSSCLFPTQVPGHTIGGGQDFDSEFIAAAQNGTKLYIAIVSGQRPDNAAANYEPADLKIGQTGGLNAGVTYGIELGACGTAAGCVHAVNGTENGVTWALNGSANSAGPGSTPAGQTTGAIFKNASFRTGAYGDPGIQLDTNTTPHARENASDPNNATPIAGSGLNIGALDALAEGASGSTTHWVIEMELDLETLLQTGTDHSSWHNTSLDLTWGPSCYNSHIEVTLTTPQGDIPNPEPATLAVFGLGILGLGALRRRKAA